MSFSFFCPCPRGLETLLIEELNEIAALTPTLKIHRGVPGGVHCSGELIDAYQINLRSRLASRVLLRLAQARYHNENDIYDLALAQVWEDWFNVDHTIRVDVTAIKCPLKSLEFITLKIKDAICDRFRDQCGRRPSVNTQEPDMRIVGFLDELNFTVYLDTSGQALFKRGWRQETGDAPLRENLAAGLLRVTGWTPKVPLFDPMCGSGTILIEAAQIAAGIPPGFNREFAFEKFNNFKKEVWNALRNSIKPNAAPTTPMIFGSDISGDAIVMTQNNLRNAGITFNIPLKQIEAQEIKPPSDTPGIMLSNPPYGERLDLRGDSTVTVDELAQAFYSAFSSTLKQRFTGWQVFLFTADLNLPRMLRLKESAKTPFFNGALDCRLFKFSMIAGSLRRKPAQINTEQ